MYTNRSISPYFPQVIFIKQKNPTVQRKKIQKKKQKTKPKCPDLKFFSESQMPKENSVVYVGADHGRGI